MVDLKSGKKIPLVIRFMFYKICEQNYYFEYLISLELLNLPDKFGSEAGVLGSNCFFYFTRNCPSQS